MIASFCNKLSRSDVSRLFKSPFWFMSHLRTPQVYCKKFVTNPTGQDGSLLIEPLWLSIRQIGSQTVCGRTGSATLLFLRTHPSCVIRERSSYYGTPDAKFTRCWNTILVIEYIAGHNNAISDKFVWQHIILIYIYFQYLNIYFYRHVIVLCKFRRNRIFFLPQ